MKATIGRFIAREILGEADRVVDDDSDLLGSGIVDSLGMMSMVFFLEQEFEVEIPPEDVTIDNFQTLKTIERYLLALKE